MTAYLLPWKPYSNSDNDLSERIPVTGATVTWKASQKPQAGNRVYFINYDAINHGIVAVGTVSAEFAVRLDDVRLSLKDGLLPIFVLVNQYPAQNWDSDSVLEIYQQQLSELWESGKGRHSLETVMLIHRQKRSHKIKERKPIWDAVDRIKNGHYDTDDMKLLWEKQKNGITTVMSAKISEDDFYKNIDLLKDFTAAIIAHPYSETLMDIMNRWKPAFPDNNPAVIHRVFRALAPDIYTFSAVGKIKDIYKPLSQYFGFPKFISKDWCEDSNSLIRLVRDNCQDQWPINEIEGALWGIHMWYQQMNNNDEIKRGKSKSKSNLILPTISADKIYGVNTILYGPPGTGKTYRVIEAAVVSR